MTISEEAAEVLEALWTLEEKGTARREDVMRESDVSISHALLDRLSEEGVITTEKSGIVRLAPKGRKLAEQIIRRHRLAERLICDVLGAEVEESEAAACEFEHVLAEGITNSICTLLGHPRTCPHNRPIPRGDCCRQDLDEVRPIVVPCRQLGVGETARIAYFCTQEHARLLKLSSLGLTPGSRIRLLQKWPSFVLLIDETEIALEEEVARTIYVRQDDGGQSS
ncbi:MAG: metal-dependent transcriptional regulator [Acidobacteria bacterium]|nr:metal-dependent transcriptional regulator [Acidobacteriota bacterium]